MKYSVLIFIPLLAACGMQSGNLAALYWTRSIPIEHWQENQLSYLNSYPHHVSPN